MRRYFYDTEFLENGSTIELISIGIVADDGREFYAVNEAIEQDDFRTRISRHAWLMNNVVPFLPLKPGTTIRPPDSNMGGNFILDDTSNVVMPRRMIRNGVRDFLLTDADGRFDPEPEVELWADYCAYDHVVLCQLFGPMIKLPYGIPMFTNDIQQAWRAHGRSPLPVQGDGAHNALEDARYVKACWDALAAVEARGVLGRISR